MKEVYYVVGQEKKRKNLLIELGISLFLIIIGFIFIYYFPAGFVLIMLGIALIISTLTIGFEANWIVKEDCIEYSSIYSIPKLKRAISILLKNQQYPDMKKIDFKDIKRIDFIFNQVPMPPYGLYGYPIYLLIHTSHQTKKLEVYINESKQQPYPALQYLNEKIGIDDPYHIMDNILDKNVKLANYLENIIKEKDLKKYP